MAFLAAMTLFVAIAVESPLEGMTKAELMKRIRTLEAQVQPQKKQLWPQLQQTPSMMWNGWLPTTRGLIPGMENNETLYYAAADRLVSSGLRDAGYDTIAATCMGWERDPVTHKLRANPKTWPRGFKSMVDYLHEQKIKICAYSDTGTYNCCGSAATSNGQPEPGIFGFEELDITTFAEWGVDHIAVDNCHSPNTSAQSIFEYQRIHDALVKVGHPMIFGIWNGGSGKPWSWAPKLGHYWRTGPDLGTKWEGRVVVREGVASSVNPASIMFNYDLQQSIPSLDSISGPGSFALLDNLALGLPPDVPHKGDPGLTLVEASTHMAIWCIMASPLIINYNIFAPDRGTVDPEVVKIVMHDEAIAINQDPLGKSAVRIDGAHSWGTLAGGRLPLDPNTWWNGEQLAKPLANGDWAVLLFNRLNTTIDITLQLVDVGNTSQLCWHVRDIWNRTDLGRFNGTFVARTVPAHGNRFLRLSGGEVCAAPPPPTCQHQVSENVTGGYRLHSKRGWYNVAGQQLVGEKGTVSINKCAAACTARGHECGAFHVYLQASRSCHIGDCYIHSLPLGNFVAGNPNSYAYDRQSVI